MTSPYCTERIERLESLGVLFRSPAGVTQLAECRLSKPDVEGSTPFTRSLTSSKPDGVFCSCDRCQILSAVFERLCGCFSRELARLDHSTMSMKYLVACVMLLTPTFVFAWGGDGHQITCLIAEDRLTPAAKEAFMICSDRM